ncbi:co-regulatory protein PtrA N-terminal domain-containing protein [Pseudomonas sp. NPDC087358]|uniref:co-regulatory protein PtrA N-terminal domain-containing protein n=1 Tax=Pseudomonas sp. NPDC087358 TaxID=3364439 RepID=UPI00384EEFF6
MKSIKTLLIVTLMTASVAAMAEDGGDKVAERMDQARQVAMAHYQQQQEHAQAIAGTKVKNNDVERSN